MSPTEKVSFFSKGKKVVFKAATKGARRASAYAQKQVGYKPTPAQRKAAAARAEKGRYRSYKTPAQRKAAARRARSVKGGRVTKGQWARCPICHKLQAVNTTAQKNAWIAAHVKRYHSR